MHSENKAYASGTIYKAKVRTFEFEESSMPFLDTGDNRPLGQDVLKRCSLDLERTRACRVLSAVHDETRHACALLAKTPDGLVFYAVGRASGPYKDVFVSSQESLIHCAADRGRPLVLSSGGFWFVYDAERILIDHVGTNERLGVRMLNYSVNLGMLWPREIALEGVWQIVKAETANRKRTTLLDYIDMGEKAKS